MLRTDISLFPFEEVELPHNKQKANFVLVNMDKIHEMQDVIKKYCKDNHLERGDQEFEVEEAAKIIHAVRKKGHENPTPDEPGDPVFHGIDTYFAQVNKKRHAWLMIKYGRFEERNAPDFDELDDATITRFLDDTASMELTPTTVKSICSALSTDSVIKLLCCLVNQLQKYLKENGVLSFSWKLTLVENVKKWKTLESEEPQ